MKIKIYINFFFNTTYRNAAQGGKSYKKFGPNIRKLRPQSQITNYYQKTFTNSIHSMIPHKKLFGKFHNKIKKIILGEVHYSPTHVSEEILLTATSALLN